MALLHRPHPILYNVELQRRYDTVDLCAIIAKFNCIPMESRDAKNGSAMARCNGDCAAIIASNADTE